MTPPPFERQIKTLQKRMETLQRQVRADPEAAPRLAQEALAGLSTALEELNTAGEELLVAEEELRQRNQELVDTRAAVEAERRRYQALFKLAPDGYLVTDAEGVIQEANDTAAQLLNTPSPSLVGKPLAVFVPPMARREFRTRVNQLATGDTKPMKNWRLPLKPRDREPIQAAIVVSATREASDTPTGLRWLIRDVTAQVQMEQALQENMEKYRVLFESFPLGITVADGAGRILESNPESERLLGITRDEQKQREIGSEEWRIVRPDGSPMPAEEYASVRALEDGRRVTNVEMGIVKPDGQVTWISVTAAPLQDGRVVVAYADISRRKEAEDKLERYAHELERSNEDLQNFAYVISHDLREPLRTTGSFLRLLDQRYAEQLDADGREFIAYAVDGVTRMRRMIEAILDLSRVETQGQALAPTDCEAVLERVLESLRYRIEETGAQVTCEPLPTVLADEAQLAQVFQNLLANALKFRRDGVAPRVHIAAQEADEWWHISVRDNGIGIEPAQAKRAFQIFQRMHTREEYEGLGIGLALCQRIVGRHGGRIWLEPAPEKGTVVHLILPKAE